MVEHHEKAATNADGLPEGAAGADRLPQQAGEGGGVLVSILGSRGIKIIFPEGDTTTTAQLQTTTRCEVNNRFFERNSPMLCCEIRFFARPTKKSNFGATTLFLSRLSLTQLFRRPRPPFREKATLSNLAKSRVI